MDVSVNSDYADYEWAIALNRACLKPFGIWPESEENKQTVMLNVRVIIATAVLVSGLIPCIHSAIRVENDIILIIDNLQYSMSIMIVTIKLFTMCWKKKGERGCNICRYVHYSDKDNVNLIFLVYSILCTCVSHNCLVIVQLLMQRAQFNVFVADLVAILKMIRDDWLQPKTTRERHIMVKHASIARFIMIFGYLIMTSSIILLVVLPCFGVTIRYLTNVTQSVRLMPMQSYYVYDSDQSPLYEISFVLQAACVIATAAVFSGTDNFWGLTVAHICGQLENLEARIVSLDMFKDFNGTLSCSVIDHIRLIRFIHILDNAFNSMILVVLVYFSTLFAFYGFVFSIILTKQYDISITRIFFFLTALLNIFVHMCLYCTIGEMLAIQSDKIYEATYMNNWYTLEPKKAKTLMIIMMQANKRLHLTAGKFFPMSISLFCNVLKTSSGYISVLLTQQTHQ